VHLFNKRTIVAPLIVAINNCVRLNLQYVLLLTGLKIRVFHEPFGTLANAVRNAYCAPIDMVVVLPTPFRGIGGRRNSAETQQSGHIPRSRREVKSERSSAKDGAPEAQMRDNPEGGELDPADDVRRRCKKFPSVLSCIGKSKKVG